MYVLGGRTKDFNLEKEALTSIVHVFDHVQRSWISKSCTGPPPPGIYGAACASDGHFLYVYGGNDGIRLHSSLHRLDAKSLVWTELSHQGPMRKEGCEMVVYGSKLTLFGGVGEREEVNQLNDDLHTFDVAESKYCTRAYTTPFGLGESDILLITNHKSEYCKCIRDQQDNCCNTNSHWCQILGGWGTLHSTHYSNIRNLEEPPLSIALLYGLHNNTLV